MIYDINNLPQSELLKFLLALKESYSVDAIDEQKALIEIEQYDKAQLRRKQLENTIAQSEYSREELLDIITTQNGQSILADHESESFQAPKELFGSYLYQGELGLLVGNDNESLSILANDIAFFVGGGGHEWTNFESPKLPTLYVDTQMTAQQFAQRYQGAFNYVPTTYARASVDALSVDGKKVLSAIISQIIKMQGNNNSPKFVIIDHVSPPLFKIAEIKTFVRELKAVKEQYGLTVLLVSNCLKKNKKPIVEDTLGTSKVILSFVDSAFAIGSSLQGDDIRYIKQLKARECQKEDSVMTVRIKNEPYLSFKYIEMTNEKIHIDPKVDDGLYYELTTEQEIKLVDMLTKNLDRNSTEYKSCFEIAYELGIPFGYVISYEMKNFFCTDNG